MAKLALQAGLWYNVGRNNVMSGDARNTPDRIASLGRCIMDTVPHFASDDNLKIPKSSGIYKITCTVTNKIYIGSAVNLYQREYDHFSTLRRNKSKCPKLQHACNKYGLETFTFEVLELVLIPEMLTAREQYWFGKLNPFGARGFNIAPIAGSNLGKTHTSETREKLRQIHLGMKVSPEAIEKISKANRGRKLTPEQLEARKGREVSREFREKLRGRKFTPEQREKLRVMRNTPEAREQNRQSHLGQKVSPEAREKLRQANLGKKMSPEAVKKSWDVRRAKQKERLSQNLSEDIQL